MPKLERIQQVMMNVARKTKEVRMKYLCKWRNCSNSDSQCPVFGTCVCTRKFYVITQFQPESNRYATDEGSCVATETFGFPNPPLASELQLYN